MHYYPRITTEDPAVVLLHGGERILPELSPSLGAFALKKMRRQGIDVRLNAAVTRVEDTAVLLAGGERIRGGTVICTVGTTPGPLLSTLPLATVRGRIVVNPDMSVPDRAGLWALGDCAAVPNSFDHRLSPPTAQFAVRQARQLAQNIVASLSGRAVKPFRYRPQGALCSIGHNKAVAELFGLRVYGFLAWLLWRAVYLSKVPTLARKVRLFMEWNWEMLFPPDIVHLRYSRTRRPKRQSPYTGGTTEMPRATMAAGEG
jgi:NADH dehydrogenase